MTQLREPAAVEAAGSASARRGPGPWGVTVVVLAAVLGACVLALVISAFRAPLTYDASYNMQVVEHLAHEGRYATDGAVHDGTSRLFDPYISTGPVVLVPAAVLVQVLGDHLWIYRLVPLAGFLLLLGAACVLGRRVAGRLGAVAVPASLLVIDTSRTYPGSPLTSPGDVLGELTCAGLVVCAALALHRPRRAGLLLGLAVMTKLLAVLAAPALLVGVLAVGLSGRRRWHGAVELAIWSAAPLVVWQVVRILSLGPAGAARANREFLLFFGSHGSGVVPSGVDGSAERLGRLLLLFPVVLAVPAVIGAVVLLHRRAGRSHERVDAAVPVLLGAGACVVLWWLFMASWGLERHVLLGLYLAVPAATALVARRLRGHEPAALGKATGPVVAVGLVAAVLVSTVAQLSVPGPSLGVQRRVADAVRTSGAGHLAAVGWWQSPEVTALSGVPGRPLDRRGGLLVIGPDVRLLSPATWRRESGLCERDVLRAGDYRVCWTSHD